MMLMDIDFLVYDYTNARCYDTQADLMFGILDSLAKQGFKVPKVTVYTNTNSPACVMNVYNRYLAPDAPRSQYAYLWYSPNGKPMIIGVKIRVRVTKRSILTLKKSFRFQRVAVARRQDYRFGQRNGFPWMSWEYPQENYNGYMSVSLAQHPGAAMSKGDMSNYGRGYDFNKSENVTGNVNLGTNYEQQWETVFKNNADKKSRKSTPL